jgi:hypothetical protein
MLVGAYEDKFGLVGQLTPIRSLSIRRAFTAATAAGGSRIAPTTSRNGGGTSRRMSWRFCREGLACQKSVTFCLPGLSFIAASGRADDEDDFGTNPKYPDHEIHA